MVNLNYLKSASHVCVSSENKSFIPSCTKLPILDIDVVKKKKFQQLLLLFNKDIISLYVATLWLKPDMTCEKNIRKTKTKENLSHSRNKNASQFWWNSPLMPKTSETQVNAHPLGSIMALSSIALFVVL